MGKTLALIWYVSCIPLFQSWYEEDRYSIYVHASQGLTPSMEI